MSTTSEFGQVSENQLKTAVLRPPRLADAVSGEEMREDTASAALARADVMGSLGRSQCARLNVCKSTYAFSGCSST